jgi:hypothetical protein
MPVRIAIVPTRTSPFVGGVEEAAAGKFGHGAIEA